MSEITTSEERAATRASAIERGWRSLLWGLLIDVATAITLVMLVSVNTIEWTSTYWTVLGLTVAKSALQAVVAFFARLLVKPREAP